MLIILALIVFLAALYFVRKWLMAEVKSVEADFEADIQGAEQGAQNVAATAEKVADGVVQEIKAKL